MGLISKYFLAVISLCLAAPLASAQLGAGGGPIDVSADRSQLSTTDNTLRYTGDVEVRQGNSILQADIVTVTFKPSNKETADSALGQNLGDPDKIIAEGNVYYATPSEKARGKKGVYSVDNDQIVLTGDVIVTQGKNILTGQSLTLRPSEGLSILEGGRVRTLIVPEEEEATS